MISFDFKKYFNSFPNEAKYISNFNFIERLDGYGITINSSHYCHAGMLVSLKKLKKYNLLKNYLNDII